MHVREYGKGNAVLLLHGMPSALAELIPLAEALAGTHRVLLPELPGYGSSPPLNPYTMSGAQRELEKLVQSRGIERLAVVGFSGGAYRAFRLALDGEIEVTRIACLAATPGPGPAEADALRQAAGALRAGADLRDFVVARFLSARSQADPRATAAVKAWLSAAPGDVMAAELEAFADEGSLGAQLSTLKVPLLLRVGESDAATPADWSREIAGAVSGARLEIVPNCGHALLIEDAVGTIDSVRSFLEGA